VAPFIINHNLEFWVQRLLCRYLIWNRGLSLKRVFQNHFLTLKVKQFQTFQKQQIISSINFMENKTNCYTLNLQEVRMKTRCDTKDKFTQVYRFIVFRLFFSGTNLINLLSKYILNDHRKYSNSWPVNSAVHKDSCVLRQFMTLAATVFSIYQYI
jgi:hypothetical protein